MNTTDISAAILSLLSPDIVALPFRDFWASREAGDGTVRMVVTPARIWAAAAGASSDMQTALMSGRIHFGMVFSVLSANKPRFLTEERGGSLVGVFVDVAFEDVFKLLFVRGVLRADTGCDLDGVETASRLRTTRVLSKYSYNFL